jgi:hypothetical protein
MIMAASRCAVSLATRRPRVGACGSLILGCFIATACTPGDPGGTAPKNGVAQSPQTKGAKDAAEDDENASEVATTGKSCTSSCRRRHSTVVPIHDELVACVAECAEDDGACIDDCGTEKALQCDASEACDALDDCLTSCEGA